MSEPISIQSLSTLIYPICRAAGEATLPFFHGTRPLHTQQKPDATPVTRADLEASRIIETHLASLPWQLPVISEENALLSYDIRQQWQSYWLVDPLDGTREFLEGSEEYTVNIALIEAGQPRWGAVYQPVTGAYYWGGMETGAWQGQDEPQRLECSDISKRLHSSRNLRILTSKRHGTIPLNRWWSEFADIYPAERVACGSSLKFCLLASGGADLYPRFGPTNEWDTGAGQAVLEGAGGSVSTRDGNSLTYNRKASLLNPDFLAIGANAGKVLEDALAFWQDPSPS